MQNVDSKDPTQTDKDNLEIAETKDPTSLSSLPEALTAATTPTATTPTATTSHQEGVQSDTEVRPKVKTRSRFTLALRKLSKSKRKKEITEAATTSPPPTEQEQETKIVTEETKERAVLTDSSGAEESLEPTTVKVPAEEEKPKKKSKLTKRFILGSLRKSKISSKKSIELEDGADVTAGPNTEETKTAAEAIAETEVAAADKPQQSERVGASRVQITISGVKVEPAPEHSQSPLSIASGSPADTDYLTPTEDPPTTSKESATNEDPSLQKEAKKKKLKLKKSPTVIAASSSSTSNTAQALPKTVTATTPTAEKKLVITQSTRDTPPPERAPAKPSRAVLTTSAAGTASSQTLAVRKPTTRSAATATSPSISQPRVSSSSASRKLRTASAAVTAISAAKSTLMQNPVSPGTLQRGHRFPKPQPATPSAALSTIKGKSSTATATAAAKTVVQRQQQKPPLQKQQPQIQLQSQSHESQSQAVPTTTTATLTAVSAEQQQQQSSASNTSNDLLLQPPTYPPPPIPNSTPFATPETQSPAHQRHSGETVTLRVSPADDSVASRHSSRPDDAISSAESANANEFSSTTSLNSQFAGDTQPQDTDYDEALLQFAIGSAVRPADDLYDSYDTLQEQLSFDSDKSSDSQSPLSEYNRKRIRYFAQPTLIEEFESLQRRREKLKFQKEAVHETVSVATENEDSTSGGQGSMLAFGDLTMDQEMEPTIMTTTAGEKREHLYKILVIGELGTGKTSFIKRYVHQFFSQNYRATIGVDFALKVLHWDKDTIVRLQLWDIAGQERFGNMTRVYYKEAVGAFIVFDVTRSGTFDCVSKWKEDLDSKVQLPDGSPIPCILLANKCDQEKQGLVTSPEKMDEYVKENGFAGWFETSAKENINIDEAARALVNKILLNDKLISDADIADSEKFNLNTSADQSSTEAKNKCSC